jgi:hypothetical protein
MLVARLDGRLADFASGSYRAADPRSRLTKAMRPDRFDPIAVGFVPIATPHPFHNFQDRA